MSHALMPPSLTPIATQRLVCRRATPADTQHIATIFGDPCVMQYITATGAPYNKKEIQEILAFFLAHEVEHGFAPWLVLQKSTHEVIGIGGLKWVKELRAIDLGFSFTPACWGMGLATEFAHALLKFGFEQVKTDRLVAHCNVQHAASKHVLEKIGMQHEGHVHRHDMLNDLYAITHSAWKNLQNDLFVHESRK